MFLCMNMDSGLSTARSIRLQTGLQSFHTQRCIHVAFLHAFLRQTTLQIPLSRKPVPKSANFRVLQALRDQEIPCGQMGEARIDLLQRRTEATTAASHWAR
uniref:Uncharacterized protein n=1 Tax=Rhodosorus marinus TaxID=101924 RepID=A0A7S2ZQG5_9RHOD